MFGDYHEEQKRRIERDLASFADPGSVATTGKGRRFTAEWTMRGEDRKATLTMSPDSGVTVHISGEPPQPYGFFLAGTQMADLRHMAQMIVQAGSREIFVPTRARRTDPIAPPSGGAARRLHPPGAPRTDPDAPPRPATDLLTDLLEQHEAEVTEVIMVTGEAGAGKTRVLQELVRRQARGYLDGKIGKLLLYVDAQGRALARLNEALATELQDLRVSLTYHSVATLARVGLLVPVIDGFDELLGVSGYDDAFNSLAIFLEQLEGHGRLIASARSVYYEEEFLGRASQASMTGLQAWSHVPVKIEPWLSGDQADYLDVLATRESLPDEERAALHRRVSEVFRENDALASKPLFFAKAVALLRRDPDFAGGDDLLGTLMHRFLEREQREKLLDRNQRPLLSERSLELLMGELAEEMWNQETRELDRGSVREVAEYVLDDGDMPESVRKIVIERMPTLAFLAPSEKHASVLFEHEVFFFHFLARALASRYVRDTDMRVVLSRSPLPEFVAERLAFEFRQIGRLSSPAELQEILDRLSEAGRLEWHRTMQVRENAGLIVLALLREFADGNGASPEISGCTISTVIFPGSHLSNVTLRSCTLVNVEIRRTDLGATKFIDCNARDVLLVEPRVKVDSTRLELKGLRVPDEVVGIHELNDDGNRKIYAPDEIATVLRKCGAPVAAMEPGDMRQVPDDLRDLLDGLVHAYEKANPLCDGDQNLQGLFRAHKWRALRRLLLEHGIVKLDSRAASGRSKEFLRRQFALHELMKGENRASHVEPQIARFWDALEDMDA